MVVAGRQVDGFTAASLYKELCIVKLNHWPVHSTTWCNDVTKDEVNAVLEFVTRSLEKPPAYAT